MYRMNYKEVMFTAAAFFLGYVVITSMIDANKREKIYDNIESRMDK